MVFMLVQPAHVNALTRTNAISRLNTMDRSLPDQLRNGTRLMGDAKSAGDPAHRRAAGVADIGNGGALDSARSGPAARVARDPYPARLMPHAMGVPTNAMWIASCGQLIEPGQVGDVLR